MGAFIYNNDTLSFALTATGRFVPEGNNFRYDHFLTDHLGSTRIVFTDLDDDGDADILQENHYYPFGMSMAGRSYLSGQDNQQLYTGKRIDEQHGLDWYAHGARYYDPQLARWHCSDPLSELYASSSPYGYVINNPINFVDPDGMRRDPAPYARDNYTSLLSDGYNRTPFENSFSFMRASGGWYYDNDTQTYSNFFGGQQKSAGDFISDLNNDLIPNFQGEGYTYEPWFQTTGGKGLETTQGEFRGFMLSGISSGDNSNKKPMTLAGLTLITDWGEEVAKINQGSNEAIRAAAIRNGIPTEVIDDIILKTGNFAHTAKWVGRGFIASGAIVSVIDATVAISEGDYNEAAMAGLDLLAGLGTAAVGGPMGILYYGGYMLIMHQPAVPRPAYISDPLSPWNTLPRIDNTYVAPNYQY